MIAMKRWIAVLLTLSMLLSGVTSLAASEGAAPVVYSHDGRVTLIDGACIDSPVNSFEDAAAVVDSKIDELGGDARTTLVPWRTLTDAFGNRYYVFQQMCNDTTVLGGAVKVIADEKGNMLGLTSSIESDLPEAEDAERVTAEAAEQIVLQHEARTCGQSVTVLDGLTKEMILPLTIEIDIEAEDVEGSRYVWVVYTDNPEAASERGTDLPYLAHYVTLSGDYLYSLPTIIPGDEAGESGFDSSYVFEFMEPVDYVGFVDLSSGSEMELTVTVMRDKRTGMYYLGNLERRIVVADCYEFLYNGGRVALESSRDNLEWDQVGLLSLYNYCRAYDYYKAIGWSGGDGEDTPILILNDFCDANHQPVDNAAYVGKYLGWQIFLASQCNDFSQCVDVLGHEFTHCVTGSVMTYNAYMNDYGAINEAMSDIQGKTMEMLIDGAENVTWEMGDRSAEPIRSMSEPHLYGQPEFAWDVYYIPNVKTPTVLNDEGGVHTNSSLLNHVAWMLYDKGGMTLEEGRAFWFTVDCAMVPGTDYPQLAELLPWALRVTGLERLEGVLRRALDATRLGVSELPDSFDRDRALITLDLPDSELFGDEQWVMQLMSVDVDKLVETAKEIVVHVIVGDYSVLPGFVRNLLEPEAEAPSEVEAEDKGLLDALLDALINADSEEPVENEPEPESNLKEELRAWFIERFKGALYYGSTNAGQDGHTMRIVTIPGYSVPILMHGVYDDNTSSLNDVYLLVYIGNRWVDLGGLFETAISYQEGQYDDAVSARMETLMDEFVNKLGSIHGIDDVLQMIFYRVEGGEINALPAGELGEIVPQVTGVFDGMGEEEVDVQPRLSRPKVVEVPDAA